MNLKRPEGDGSLPTARFRKASYEGYVEILCPSCSGVMLAIESGKACGQPYQCHKCGSTSLVPTTGAVAQTTGVSLR